MKKEGELNSTVFSNGLESLADRLIDFLYFQSEHPLFAARPFERRLVVVPDAAMKEFLYRIFLSSPRLQVVAGVKILPLNQAVTEIIEPKSKKRIPSFAALSLAIEEKLWGLSSHPAFAPLQTYFSGSEERKSQRVAQLSDELARLFGWYGLHGPHFLKNWLADRREDWQKCLWKEVFSPLSPWTYPVEALRTASSERFLGKMALFGFTYLPLPYLSFFLQKGASLFQLSPSVHFWADLATDKERIRLRKRLVEKRVAEDAVEMLCGENNALLSNWGKLYRAMSKNLDLFPIVEEDAYLLEEDRASLLFEVRRSLLFLDPLEVKDADDSIQIHSATTKLREVEVLRDALATLLDAHQKKGDPISLSEILVFAPEMCAYSPYIEMVFGGGNLPFAIHGLELASLSAAVRGFFQWLHLLQDNFQFSSVFDLWENSAFAEKWGFSLEEVSRLSLLCKSAKVHAECEGSSNSWLAGIERLLQGFAFSPDADTSLSVWPLEGLGQSDMVLFNRFAHLLNEIQGDLRSVWKKRSAAEWMHWAIEMSEKYLNYERGSEPFFQELHSLAFSVQTLSAPCWSFESIQRIFRQIAERKSGVRNVPELERVIFSSLAPGKIVSARVIWCLGMDEGAFPRTESKSALSQVEESTCPDYFPSRLDVDRSLFLDLVLNAKDYLIFSYERVQSQDLQQQSYSLLIDELQQYVGNAIVPMEHPVHSFDFSYFSENAQVKKWNRPDFLAAKAFYISKDKQGRPLFFDSSLPAQEIPETIDLKDLKKCARDPVEFYLQKRLGIYFRSRKEEKEEEFVLSNLERGALRNCAVREGFEKVSCRSAALGALPRGIFKEAAIADLFEETSNDLDVLQELGICPRQIGSVHFCNAQEMQEGMLPAIEVSVQGKIVRIVGTLSDVTPLGLIFRGNADWESLVCVWPLYLAYRCAFGGQKPLLLTKAGKVLDVRLASPQASLSLYVEYYLQAQQKVSPLMPKWAKSLLSQGDEEFTKTVHASLRGEQQYAENLPLNYLQRRGAIKELIACAHEWRPIVQKVFAEGLDAL